MEENPGIEILRKFSPEQLKALSPENIKMILEFNDNSLKKSIDQINLLINELNYPKNDEYIIYDSKDHILYRAFINLFCKCRGKKIYIECDYIKDPNDLFNIRYYKIFPIKVLTEKEAEDKYVYPEKLVEIKDKVERLYTTTYARRLNKHPFIHKLKNKFRIYFDIIDP